jgi:hypothetical protein
MGKAGKAERAKKVEKVKKVFYFSLKTGYLFKSKRMAEKKNSKKFIGPI